MVSLIGRSGIGKTQLFRILAGLQKPTSGTVELKNKETVKAGDMGVIFQNYYLFEWRTVYQSLFACSKTKCRIERNRKRNHRPICRSVQFERGTKKYPQQLSGGQRQRASIIQQLLKGSDFLLLDEPFSGLDVCV